MRSAWSRIIVHKKTPDMQHSAKVYMGFNDFIPRVSYADATPNNDVQHCPTVQYYVINTKEFLRPEGVDASSMFSTDEESSRITLYAECLYGVLE